MQIGSIVKSFDFPGNDQCFMVGQVTEIDEQMITCRTSRIVFQGQDKEVTVDTQFFRTARQGFGFMDELFTRVVELH